MFRQYISVFFATLVCSILGHEFKKAQDLSHQLKRHLHDHNLQNQLTRHYPLSLETCDYVCPIPNPKPGSNPTNPLRLIKLGTIHAFGVLDVKLNVTILFSHTSTLLINGATGATILINFEDNVGTYSKPGSSIKQWNSSKIDLVNYLTAFDSIRTVEKWEAVQSFDLDNTSKPILNDILHIIKPLSPEIAERAEVNPQVVVQIIDVLGEQLIQCKDVVILLFESVNSSVVVIEGDLMNLLNTLMGLFKLHSRIKGGIERLLTDRFNLAVLLSSSSGFETMLYLLLQAGDDIDLQNVLTDILKSPEDLFGAIVNIDGGTYAGIRGIVAIINILQLYVAKAVNLEAVTDIWIQVAASNNFRVDISEWKEFVHAYFGVIKVQSQKFKNDVNWSSLAKFFHDIKTESLTIGNINISAIINTSIMSSGSIDLSSLIKSLLQLEVVVSAVNILSTLFLRLVWFVASGEGVTFILSLIPSTLIKIQTSGIPIIKQILKDIDITKLFIHRATLNVVGIIPELPVIGSIFRSIEVGLRSSERKINLGLALKKSGFALREMENWIWFGLGLEGGKEPSGSRIAGSGLLGGGVFVNINTSFAIISHNIGSESVSSENGPIKGSTIVSGTPKIFYSSSNDSSNGWAWYLRQILNEHSGLSLSSSSVSTKESGNENSKGSRGSNEGLTWSWNGIQGENPRTSMGASVKTAPEVGVAVNGPGLNGFA